MEELNVGMKKQVMTFQILEEYCQSKYRKGTNPLPDVRKWLENMGVELSVTYFETDVPINITKVVEWAEGKKRPMAVVHVLKIEDYVLAVAVFMLEGKTASRPAKNYAIFAKPVCHHCKLTCTPVELNDDTYARVDMYGVETLTEVDQFLYEGGTLCKECYYKEGGSI